MMWPIGQTIVVLPCAYASIVLFSGVSLLHPNALSLKEALQVSEQLQLLFCCERGHHSLQNCADGDVLYLRTSATQQNDQFWAADPNERAVVHIGEHAHHESVSSAGQHQRRQDSSAYWQSIRSVIPPWPGIECPKSLMLNALLKPDAKNPPKGATRDAKVAMTRQWIWKGAYGTVGGSCPN